MSGVFTAKLLYASAGRADTFHGSVLSLTTTYSGTCAVLPVTPTMPSMVFAYEMPRRRICFTNAICCCVM